MYTYAARVIADQATGRPLAGVRVVAEDAETGLPVQAYRDGEAVSLVTGAHGLIAEWQTEETTRRVALTAGSVRLTQWCEEVMGGAQDAADRAEAAMWPKGALGDTDLNALTTPGTYWQSTPNFATKERGYPEEGALGVLVVEKAATTIATQRFTRYDLAGFVETLTRTVSSAGVAPTPWRREPVTRLTTAADSAFADLAPGMYYVPFLSLIHI